MLTSEKNNEGGPLNHTPPVLLATATMTPAHGPIAMAVMAVPIMSKKRGSRKAATM